MDKNDIPESWSMSDDLAKRISELVNKKPYRPEDDLNEAIECLARDITLIELNLVGCGGWVIYLLERMEGWLPFQFMQTKTEAEAKVHFS